MLIPRLVNTPLLSLAKENSWFGEVLVIVRRLSLPMLAEMPLTPFSSAANVVNVVSFSRPLRLTLMLLVCVRPVVLS